jgi:HEAT repeat protein
MVSISNGLPHPGNAFFLIELILASLAGITALLAFILIRRVTRSVHFRRHDALAFAIRKQWSEILNGVVPAESWRQDPMRREIVQTNVLQELEDACPKDRPRFQQFMRTTGLLDACIDQARTGRTWQRRQALVTLGGTLMCEAIPALAEALDDRHLETRLAAIRGLARVGLSQAAEPILERLMTSELRIPPHPIANALVRCCRKHPEALLPYLRQAQGEVREIIARVAGEIASPEMADEIVLLAGDPLPEVRASSARALAVAPLPLALPALAGLARDTVWFVRLRAIASIDAIRHPRAIPILLEALSDSNRLVRLRAAAALVEFIQHRTRILENVVDSQDRYALHAMISALELAGDFGKILEELSDPVRHDATAERLLSALHEGMTDLWSTRPADRVLEKA